MFHWCSGCFCDAVAHVRPDEENSSHQPQVYMEPLKRGSVSAYDILWYCRVMWHTLESCSQLWTSARHRKCINKLQLAMQWTVIVAEWWSWWYCTWQIHIWFHITWVISYVDGSLMMQMGILANIAVPCARKSSSFHDVLEPLSVGCTTFTWLFFETS